MRKFLHDHSLSLALAGLYLFFKIGAIWTTPEDHFWYATMHGHSDDVLGALLIVLATKWLYERKSRI